MYHREYRSPGRASQTAASPSPLPSVTRPPATASLFRAGLGLRLALALGLSALVWLAVLWATAS